MAAMKRFCNQNTELSEEDLDKIVSDIVKSLNSSPLGLYLQRSLEDEIVKPKVKLSDLEKGLVTASVHQVPWQRRLGNTVFQHLMIRYGKCGTDIWGLGAGEKDKESGLREPISYIRKAQVNWEKRIVKSINSMCTELNVPLAQRRNDKEQKEIRSKWAELGTLDIDLSTFRPVYAAKDFLEVISSLRNPNLAVPNNSSISSSCCLVQVPLKVKNRAELCSMYSQLSLTNLQTGLYDSCEGMGYAKLISVVLASGHSAAAMEISKRGCPISHRGTLWSIMLGVDALDIDLSLAQYDAVKQDVVQYSLLIDSLLFKDVKLTATNDDQYFVFEDYLYQILLPFSRDIIVLEHLQLCGDTTPASAYIRGDHGDARRSVTYPPNGVVPFHGFSMYVAPLCYVYNQPSTLYLVFRALYIRYFHRLHTLSSHPQGILSLCVLFEKRLKEEEPILCSHLHSIGVQPLRIAFKWLIRAFSGYLAAHQVLELWDRVLAYNSLEILPLLAVAIFSYRSSNLRQADSTLAAEAVLADLLTLEVIPLLQLSLFTVS